MTPRARRARRSRKAVGRPETTATSAKRSGQVGQERGHAGQRPRRRSGRRRWRPACRRSRGTARCAPGRPPAGAAARGGRAAASPAPGKVRRRHGRRRASTARSSPMTTTTSVPVTPLTGVGARERQHLGRLDADGGGDGRRLLLARRVVHGRGRLGGRRVDRRLHRPAAAADDRRVVRGQPVGARGVGHDDTDRGWARTVVVVVVMRRLGAPPSWWWSRRRRRRRSVVVVPTPPRRRRRGRGDAAVPAPCPGAAATNRRPPTRPTESDPTSCGGSVVIRVQPAAHRARCKPFG